MSELELLASSVDLLGLVSMEVVAPVVLVELLVAPMVLDGVVV
jgi:hypothetical protein